MLDIILQHCLVDVNILPYNNNNFYAIVTILNESQEINFIISKEEYEKISLERNL